MTTQTSDRDGVDGVQALDGVHGDLRSEAKCTGKFGFQHSQQGDRLAALLLPTPSRGGLAASSRGYSPKWPIEIWYGEDLTQQG